MTEWLRASAYATSGDETTRILARRGSFHAGRIAAFLWRGNDDWNIDREKLKTQIDDLETSTEIAKHFEDAFEILVDIVRDSAIYAVDVDRAIKGSALDKDIDKQLHSSEKP